MHRNPIRRALPRLQTALRLAALGALGTLAAPAHAAWLGLADGHYAINLNCTLSTVISCPSTISGEMTIAGSGATSMDFGVDSIAFNGDPFDTLFEGSIVDYESSSVQAAPFSFLSLRLVLDGALSGFGPGDRFWVYCHNNAPTTCLPQTQGTWTARLIDAEPVPAPPTLALGAVALGLLAATARRQAQR